MNAPRTISEPTAIPHRLRRHSPAGRQPLLVGTDAERARADVAAIVQALEEQATVDERESDPPGGPGGLVDHSLAGGDAGLAVFHTCLANAGYGEQHREVASRHLNRAIDSLQRHTMPPWLYQGFAGVAWAVEHLSCRSAPGDAALTAGTLEDEAEDPLESIDTALRGFLRRPLDEGEFELIAGVAGIGVYALQRMPRPGARELLALVVDRLEERAEECPEGIFWRSNSTSYPIRTGAASYSGPYLNLGLAHGMPGVTAVLARIYGAGVERARAGHLLEEHLRWFFRQEMPPDSPSRYPSMLVDGLDPAPCRLAWCYGDAGIAAALVSAALAKGNETWRRSGMELARHAARRPPETSGVVDAALCHGAAGLGHTFHRLYNATGDEALAEAARRWFRMTLDLRRPGEGIGGYMSWQPQGEGRMDWAPEAGLLTGASGIALALLTALAEIVPDWDQFLMTDMPTTKER